MADAKMCDICGKYYLNDMYNTEIRKKRGVCAYKYDLCDECSKEFEKWIKNTKKGK